MFNPVSVAFSAKPCELHLPAKAPASQHLGPLVKYTARTCRNNPSLVRAIHLHCSGLDLAPEATKLPNEPRS